MIISLDSHRNNTPTFLQKDEYKINDGAMLSLSLLRDKYLIGCNRKINIFDISNPESINLISSTPLNDFCCSAEVLGDKHLVCSYFTPNSTVYSIDMGERSENITLKIRANDYDCERSGVIQVVEDYKYIIAETDGRIRLCELLDKPRNDDEKFRVFTRGRYLTHTQINTITKGYIKKQQDKIENLAELNSSNIEDNTYIFGTACGQIGMIQAIPVDVFYYLNFLEWVMNRELRCLGDFDQINFRMNDPKDDPYEKLELLDCHKLSKRFIDGDFVSTFSSLTQEKQEAILAKVNTYHIDENKRPEKKTIEWINSIIKSLMICSL